MRGRLAGAAPAHLPKGHPVNNLAITWLSNAPWAGTGYGTQTDQATKRMVADGHAVAISSNYGLEAMETEWEGVHIFPRGAEAYSNDVVGPNFRKWSKSHPDLTPALFVLFDAWVLKGPTWDQVPHHIWTMVDHLPVPPEVMKRLANPLCTPISVTRFGQTEIERQGKQSPYIPMAIDTNLYQPTDAFIADGREMTGRAFMGFDEDTFVVSIINANKGQMPARKAWGENLLAFSIFAQRHDDVRLYLHTERFGSMQGVALDPLLKAVGLTEGRHFKFVNQYTQHTGIPNEVMAALYTSSDVLLASTLGEGFGLTVLEAQGCGTPVIVNDFSAQPELVGEGWLTDNQPWWDPMQMAWFATPQVPSIVEALEAAYQRGRGRSEKARAKALEYDADRVFAENWRPYLAQIAEAANADPVTHPMAARSWRLNDEREPRLTIYIPAYKRASVVDLAKSLAPQLTADVEVIISDDDPEGTYGEALRQVFVGTTARVEYQYRGYRLGGNENLLRGLSDGSGEWVWQISDDDLALPGAVAGILQAIDATKADRLIVLTPEADTPLAGIVGTAEEIAAHDPGLLIAATLITANVLRRSALDIGLGRECMDTLYGCSYANTSCNLIEVLPDPVFRVGTGNVGQYVAQTKPDFDHLTAWRDLIESGYYLTWTDEFLSWNFVAKALA